MVSRRVRVMEWYSRQPRWVKGLAFAGGALAGIGAGIAAAPAVGAMISAAGFGVAGGTLSGAAASSAGLAALGGGSIAAGGFGVSGGTALVAAAAAVSGATGVAVASHDITARGERMADLGRRARETTVDNDGIRFE